MPDVLLTQRARDALLALIADNYGRPFMDPTVPAEGGYLFAMEPEVAAMLEAFRQSSGTISDALVRFIAPAAALAERASVEGKH